MNIFTITLISDKLKIINTNSCPIILEVVDSESFINGKFNKNNIILVDGFELAVELFQNNASFTNHSIAEDVYWFYSQDELESIDSYYSKLKEFIFDNIFTPIKNYVCTVVYDTNQLNEIGNNIFKINNTKNNIDYLFDGEKIYLIDYNYLSFITGNPKYNIENLNLPTTKNLKSFNDIRIRLKEQGLVDKHFNFSSYFDYFKFYNYKTDDHNEFYKWLIIYFYHLSFYNSIDKNVIKLINSNILGIQNLNKYNNFYENIFIVENYFSNIKIKNINFNKFKELEFPIQDGMVQYEYNGSDTVTGRIYPINLNKNQSLQTLSKEQRVILNADKNCTFIEFDYKSFEFDILCHLSNITITDNFDPHIDVVEYLFGKDFIDDEINQYRQLGKKINYSLIYGMNLDKIIDSIVDEFCNDEDKAEIEKSYIEQIRDFLKLKIENHWIIKAIKELTDNIIKNNFNFSNLLLTNHFGRFIRVEKRHAILNNFISSTASDFLYLKIRLIIDLLSKKSVNLKKNKIILQNHDSILLQLENKLIEETDIFETIKEIMEADINGIIGRVRYEYGTNWGKLK